MFSSSKTLLYISCSDKFITMIPGQEVSDQIQAWLFFSEVWLIRGRILVSLSVNNEGEIFSSGRGRTVVTVLASSTSDRHISTYLHRCFYLMWVLKLTGVRKYCDNLDLSFHPYLYIPTHTAAFRLSNTSTVYIPLETWLSSPVYTSRNTQLPSILTDLLLLTLTLQARNHMQ